MSPEAEYVHILQEPLDRLTAAIDRLTAATEATTREFATLVAEARANHVRWQHEAEVLEECVRPLCLGAKLLLWPNIENPRTSALVTP
jgi:hypothetical protein